MHLKIYGANILEFNPMLTESHFLHSFISGLQEEIKHNVVMFKPQTLDKVYKLAENEEKKLNALWRRNFIKGTISNPRLSQTRLFEKPSIDPKLALEVKVKQSKFEFKKGQLFKCGDRWVPGHQCKPRTLHQIEGDFLEEEDVEEEEIVAEFILEEGEIEGKVTLNCISCQYPPNTLKLIANTKN